MEKAEKEKKLKIIVPFRSVPTQRIIGNYKKNSKKIEKTKQYHYGFISSQNKLEKAEIEKKCKLSFHSVPTRRVIQNSKKIAKQFKKLNNSIMASFHAKIGRKRPRKRKNINYHSVLFNSYTTRNRKFQKNRKKIQKVKKYHYRTISSQNWMENAEKERK